MPLVIYLVLAVLIVGYLIAVGVLYGRKAAFGGLIVITVGSGLLVLVLATVLGGDSTTYNTRGNNDPSAPTETAPPAATSISPQRRSKPKFKYAQSINGAAKDDRAGKWRPEGGSTDEPTNDRSPQTSNDRRLRPTKPPARAPSSSGAPDSAFFSPNP